jgi:hypothetical protein
VLQFFSILEEEIAFLTQNPDIPVTIVFHPFSRNQWDDCAGLHYIRMVLPLYFQRHPLVRCLEVTSFKDVRFISELSKSTHPFFLGTLKFLTSCVNLAHMCSMSIPVYCYDTAQTQSNILIGNAIKEYRGNRAELENIVLVDSSWSVLAAPQSSGIYKQSLLYQFLEELLKKNAENPKLLQRTKFWADLCLAIKSQKVAASLLYAVSVADCFSLQARVHQAYELESNSAIVTYFKEEMAEELFTVYNALQSPIYDLLCATETPGAATREAPEVHVLIDPFDFSSFVKTLYELEVLGKSISDVLSEIHLMNSPVQSNVAPSETISLKSVPTSSEMSDVHPITPPVNKIVPTTTSRTPPVTSTAQRAREKRKQKKEAKIRSRAAWESDFDNFLTELEYRPISSNIPSSKTGAAKPKKQPKKKRNVTLTVNTSSTEEALANEVVEPPTVGKFVLGKGEYFFYKN